ncbi:hypothetical protein ABQX22_11355 [Xanthomonas sp. WHRI 1810A]|uniref:hypothetical protein n=1 Tax=Xanthomonas sp. WHRI 1810A TaxID=3161565 RepID=UPI0032E8F967
MDMIAYYQFRLRFFTVFMGVIFSAIASFAISVGLGLITFFRDIPLDKSFQYAAWIGLVFSVLLAFFNFMIVKGRPRWLWGIVVILVSCLFFNLATIEYRPDRLTYMVGVLCPLLGLYLLNTNRHRDMRKILVRERQQRVAIKDALNAQCLLEKKRASLRARRQLMQLLKRK